MEEAKTVNYSEKFKNLMDEESIYEFFLKMQNILQKYSKKNERFRIFFIYYIYNRSFEQI